MWCLSSARRAERDSGGGFTAGFLVGGALFGVLGFLFAPQVSFRAVVVTTMSSVQMWVQRSEFH